MRALPVWVNGIFLCQPSENKIGPSWSALMSRWWRHAFDNKHLVRLMRLVIKGASHPWPVGGVLQPCLQGAFNQPWHMNEEELCSLAHPSLAALPVSCIRCSLPFPGGLAHAHTTAVTAELCFEFWFMLLYFFSEHMRSQQFYNHLLQAHHLWLAPSLSSIRNLHL